MQRESPITPLSGQWGAWDTHSAITKGAVPNFTRGLAQEWAEHSITFNAIGPGMFPSEMMQVDEGTEQFLASRVPIGRSGKLHELCGQLLLFASDMYSYTTGQTIYIDGGLTSV